jgi:hypothetical protein
VPRLRWDEFEASPRRDSRRQPRHSHRRLGAIRSHAGPSLRILDLTPLILAGPSFKPWNAVKLVASQEKRRVGSEGTSRLRQCCEESRPQGGQASDQASERGARPVPACSPGQLNAKTPQAGVSKTRRHERARSSTSLANGPDGTASLSQQDLSVRVRVVPSGAVGRLVPVLFVCDPRPD